MQINCTNCPVPLTSKVTLSSTCGGPSFLLFMGILESFIRKQCDLDDPCNRVISRDEPNTSYDYVVIGAGSAGSVVASRLSEERDYSVLLLETGLDEPGWLHVPSFFVNPIHTDLDWQYSFQSEGNDCSNENAAQCYWPRGKVLGGTSTINAMLYMRGAHEDFNKWERMGNSGWSFEDVLPFFKRSENNLQMNRIDREYHGQEGPLPVTQFNYHPPMSYDILKAAKELGYDNLDLNGRNHTGFAIGQSTSRRGSRYSTARAFLRPARNRHNLHIMLNSTATRIIFNNNKTAIAVEFYKNGKFIKIGVNREVIVSGGIINSPQILLNSGIGPRADLEAIGIPLIHDLPGVGRNLHDQVHVPLTFSINETDKNDLNWASVIEYLQYRTGPLSGIGILQTTGFINTKYANPQEDYPDIQMVFGGYMAACSENGMINRIPKSRRKIAILPVVIHPKSKGYLRLRNNNPLSKPLIYPRYMSNSDDIAVQIEGIKFALRFASTNAFRKYDIQFDRSTFKICEHLEFGSEPYWQCVVRNYKSTVNHQAGSCKMGPDSDPLAVVDHLLRVKGVRGVRVADASVMPQATSGNTNAPAIMIGERVVDFIRNVK